MGGVGHPEQQVVFNAYEFAYGDKPLRGTWFGSGDPRIEFPRLLKLWNAGRLDLDGMISSRSRLADINSAFAELQAGRSTRIVLTACPALLGHRAISPAPTTRALPVLNTASPLAQTPATR